MFVISMASHLYVLSKVELSFAYPFLSLAYVAVAVFAYFLFREDLNALAHRRHRLHLRRHRADRAKRARPRGRGRRGVALPRSSERDRSMRHVIFGGDGFVGRHLAPKLIADGHEVVVADISRSDLPHYRSGALRQAATSPIRRPVEAVGVSADDMVYNLSAKMLSPIQVRAKRHDFFWPVNVHGTENIVAAMDKAGASRLVHFTTDMIYGHTVTHPMTEEHPVAPLGEYGWSKQKTEELAAEWRKRGMQHLAVPAAPDHRARAPRHPGEAVQADRLELAGADDRLGQEPLSVHLGVRLRRSGARRLQGRRAERGLQSRLAQPAAGQEAARRPHQACRLEVAADPDAGLGGQAHARPARPPQHADHGPRAISDRRRDVRARCRQGRAPARLGAAVPRRGHADRRLQGISPEEGRPRRRTPRTCRPNRSQTNDHHDKAASGRSPHRRCGAGTGAGKHRQAEPADRRGRQGARRGAHDRPVQGAHQSRPAAFHEAARLPQGEDRARRGHVLRRPERPKDPRFLRRLRLAGLRPQPPAHPRGAPPLPGRKAPRDRDRLHVAICGRTRPQHRRLLAGRTRHGVPRLFRFRGDGGGDQGRRTRRRAEAAEDRLCREFLPRQDQGRALGHRRLALSRRLQAGRQHRARAVRRHRGGRERVPLRSGDRRRSCSRPCRAAAASSRPSPNTGRS